MKKISRKKWKRFLRSLAFWLFRTEPPVLVPTELPDLHRFKAEMIRICKQEKP